MVSIHARSQKTIRNTVKAGAFLGSANLAYERVIGKGFAVAVTPALGIFSANEIRYSIAGGGLELRYYLPVLKRLLLQVSTFLRALEYTVVMLR